jgi:excisionase family DNA binding protein
MGIVSTIENWPGAMTVQELCQLMKLSKKSIYKQIRAGKLVAVRVDSSYRLDPPDVIAWINSSKTRRSLG